MILTDLAAGSCVTFDTVTGVGINTIDTTALVETWATLTLIDVYKKKRGKNKTLAIFKCPIDSSPILIPPNKAVRLVLLSEDTNNHKRVLTWLEVEPQ